MKNKLLLLIALCTVAACTELTDTDPPEVLLEFPETGATITTDQGLHVSALLTDNTGLIQYKLTLSGIDSLNGIGADSTISFILVEGIADKEREYQLDRLIELPDTTFNGHYHLTLACIDVEGNVSSTESVSFKIRNIIDSIPPVLDVHGPLANDTLRFGQNFVMSGTITDNFNLMYAEYFLGKADFSDTLKFVTFPYINNDLVDFDNVFSWYFQVDSTWAPGKYHLYCTAWDDYSGAEQTIPFYVAY